MSSVLTNPRPTKMHKTSTGRNVELALRRAIGALAGKNVSDNEKQLAIRDCERALDEVRAK